MELLIYHQGEETPEEEPGFLSFEVKVNFTNENRIFLWGENSPPIIVQKRTTSGQRITGDYIDFLEKNLGKEVVIKIGAEASTNNSKVCTFEIGNESVEANLEVSLIFPGQDFV